MPCQSYAPYRGFKIDVRVTAGKTLCLHDIGRRYKVSWTINSCSQPAQKVAGFPRATGIHERAGCVQIRREAGAYVYQLHALGELSPLFSSSRWGRS